MDKKTLISMKKIILFVVLCHIQSSMFAQDVDSLIGIRGYYVTVFSKQEIVFSYEQKVKKEKGESYSIPIDYSHSSFFIPVQIGNKIVCKDDMITDSFLNNVHNNDSIYAIPRRSDNDFLKKINAVTMDVSKETVLFSEAMRFSPYYKVRGNDNFLFNCVYIEGYAQHKTIQQIEEKWQQLLLSMFGIGKKPENQEFFFIVKITDYTPYPEIQRLEKWLPYLDEY